MFDVQMAIENKFSRTNIDKYILNEIETSPEIVAKIHQGACILDEWISKSYYDSKNARLSQLKDLDLYDLVREVAVHILPMERSETFTSVVGRVASLLSYSSKIDGIKTLAEILAVVCQTDLFDIFKSGEYGVLHIKSNYRMSDETSRFIAQTKYLPPMVCKPNIVNSNSDSGYLTKRESLILGSGNFHQKNICLDSINRFNQIPLALDTRLLTKFAETSTKELDTKEKADAYSKMILDSYLVYTDLVEQGNKFYLTHKVDKRGRTYSQGYHVNSQGSEYKKAIINLHKREVIELPTK
jgi:hypothetical protein